MAFKNTKPKIESQPFGEVLLTTNTRHKEVCSVVWAMHQGIKNRQQSLPLTPQNPTELITGPDEAMENDLVPDLLPSGGNENILTSIDLFSGYLFAYRTSSRDAEKVARAITKIINKHAWLLTAIISGKVSASVCHLVFEVAGISRKFP